jgi:hypothetical protein
MRPVTSFGSMVTYANLAANSSDQECRTSLTGTLHFVITPSVPVTRPPRAF